MWEIRSILNVILDSVVILTDTESKIDWIHRGALDLLFKVLLRTGDDGDFVYSTVNDIVKYLLRDNLEGCRSFVQLCLSALTDSSTKFDWECVGIYKLISALLKNPYFREVISNIFFSKVNENGLIFLTRYT